MQYLILEDIIVGNFFVTEKKAQLKSEKHNLRKKITLTATLSDNCMLRKLHSSVKLFKKMLRNFYSKTMMEMSCKVFTYFPQFPQMMALLLISKPVHSAWCWGVMAADGSDGADSKDWQSNRWAHS